MCVQIYGRHETRLRWMCMYLRGVVSKDRMTQPEETYPTKCDEGAFLSELEHKFLLVHCTGVARRVLLRNEQCRDTVLMPLVLPEQQSTRLAVPLRVDLRDRKEAREALAWEAHALQRNIRIEHRVWRDGNAACLHLCRGYGRRWARHRGLRPRIRRACLLISVGILRRVRIRVRGSELTGIPIPVRAEKY